MRRYVVAVTAEASAAEVLALARVEHTRNDPVLDVVTVIPAGWPFRSKASVDAEFVAFHTERAAATLDHARQLLADIPSAEFHVVHEHGSAADSLLRYVEETGADAIVLGSPRGRPGRFNMGSTTNILLHGSPIPVALAPEGYAPPPGTELSRVTIGVSGGPGQEGALALGVDIAREGEVPLRLATVQVMDSDMAIPVVGFDAERIVDAEWKTNLEELHREILAGLPPELSASSVVTKGETWEAALDALEPEDGEVLVIGCSGHGRLRQVFLGTYSGKIVRSAGLPVVIAPARGA